MARRTLHSSCDWLLAPFLLGLMLCLFLLMYRFYADLYGLARELLWVLAFPLMLATVMLLLAIADWLSDLRRKRPD